MYTTLEKVKRHFTSINDEFDPLLTDLITEVSSKIDGYCNRKLASDTYTDEVYNGSNVHGAPYSQLRLRNFPVISLSSLKYRSAHESTGDTFDTYGAEEYVTEAKTGLISMLGGFFSAGRANIKVTYTAGYLIDFDSEDDDSLHTLPQEITAVATSLVVQAFNQRQSHGTTSEQVGSNTITYVDGMPKSAIEVLDKYRVYEF